MSNRSVILASLALSTLVGCNADGFNKHEAQTVAQANNDAMSGAYSSMASDMASRSTTSQLQWNDDGAGNLTFSGSLTSDGAAGEPWTGTITVDGDVTTTDTSAAWTVTTTYDAVTVDDVTLDGDLTWDWSLAFDETGFSMSSTTDGTITATGDAEGTGEIHTSADIDVGLTGASATVTGTVDGHKVDFDASVMAFL